MGSVGWWGGIVLLWCGVGLGGGDAVKDRCLLVKKGGEWIGQGRLISKKKKSL